jgi:hypothetical protein
MPFRSEKQRAAFEALRPQTKFEALEIYIDYSLLGELYQHSALGIELQYGWSFISPQDGEEYHGGRVVRCRKGTGIRVGSEWACQADKLRKVT